MSVGFTVVHSFVESRVLLHPLHGETHGQDNPLEGFGVGESCRFSAFDGPLAEQFLRNLAGGELAGVLSQGRDLEI